MIRLLSVLALGVAFLAYTTPVSAADKEVKLDGTIQCGKCHLKVTDKCAAAIVVKGKDGKDVVYMFDTDAHKKYHDDICQEKKKGTVTGTVKKDGDKNILTVTKLEYAK